jgi:hypothetical protein
VPHPIQENNVVQQAKLVQNEMFQLFWIRTSKWFLKKIQEEESRCDNYETMKMENKFPWSMWRNNFIAWKVLACVKIKAKVKGRRGGGGDCKDLK